MKNLFRVEIRTCEIKVEFRKDRRKKKISEKDSLSLVFLLLQKDIYTEL